MMPEKLDTAVISMIKDEGMNRSSGDGNPELLD